MSETIDLTKIVLVIENLCNMQFFINIFVRTVLTDLLDISIPVHNCQHCDEQQFQYTVMYILHDFSQ